MKEIVFIAEESDEGGFIARALGESIFTQADSMEALHDEVRDAVRCHFGEDDRTQARLRNPAPLLGRSIRQL